MSKKALILYSGGKDSHLALLWAIKNNFNPYPVHLNLPVKLKINFLSNPVPSNFIKIHFRLMGINGRIIEIKEKPAPDLFLKLIKNMKFDYYISSNDHEETLNDRYENKEIFKILKRNKITPISFKKIIKKDSTFKAINLILHLKIKAVIIGISKDIDLSYLGKNLDDEFIKMMKNKRKNGVNVDENSFQSYVISSPLFNGREIKVEFGDKIIFNKEHREYFLNFKKYKIISQSTGLNSSVPNNFT